MATYGYRPKSTIGLWLRLCTSYDCDNSAAEVAYAATELTLPFYLCTWSETEESLYVTKLQILSVFFDLTYFQSQ